MEEVLNQEVAKKPTRRISSTTLVNALLFLVPTFFIPLSIIPLQFSKTLITFGFVVALLVALCISVVRTSSLTLFRSPVLFSLWILPLVYLVSAIFSKSPDLSFWGYQLGTDTFGFVLFFAALVTTVVAVYKKEALSGAFKALLYTTWATFIFQLIQILFRAPFPFAALGNSTINSLGRWTDFGIYSGLVALLILLSYLSIKNKRRTKIALGITFVVALMFMILINLKEVWVVFGAVSLALSVMMLGQLRGNSISALGIDRLVLPFVGLIAAIFFGFFGSGVALSLQDALGINSLEVRPSVGGTFEVLQSVYKESPVFGSGPNTFAQDWDMYRDEGVLTSLFWNTTFSTGSGFVLTAFATGGIVVALAWLLLTGLIIYTVIRALFTAQPDPRSYIITALSGVGLVYLLVMHYVFAPSQSLTLLFGLFFALFLVSLKGTALIKPISIQATKARTYYALVVGVVFVGIALMTSAIGVGRLYISTIQHERSVVAANNGDFERAESRINSALSLSTQDRYYRTAALVYSADFNQIISNVGEEPTPEQQNAFQNALARAIENANLARESDPRTFENLFVRALIFSNVVPLGIKGAFENAVAALEEARTRNPKNPEIDFRLAGLELTNENEEGARAYLEEALKKKPNYTSAILLLAQIDLNAGNLKEAIEAVRAAVYFEPQNSELLYQLGILLLQDKNYEQAAAAFELAIQNQPNYANAAFFLSQSYAFLNRIDDATVLMRELERTNPENETVSAFLDALEAGENPFDARNIASPDEEDAELE